MFVLKILVKPFKSQEELKSEPYVYIIDDKGKTSSNWHLPDVALFVRRNGEIIRVEIAVKDMEAKSTALKGFKQLADNSTAERLVLISWHGWPKKSKYCPDEKDGVPYRYISANKLKDCIIPFHKIHDGAESLEYGKTKEFLSKIPLFSNKLNSKFIFTCYYIRCL
jgi:hypothetical protein